MDLREGGGGGAWVCEGANEHTGAGWAGYRIPTQDWIWSHQEKRLGTAELKKIGQRGERRIVQVQVRPPVTPPEQPMTCFVILFGSCSLPLPGSRSFSQSQPADSRDPLVPSPSPRFVATVKVTSWGKGKGEKEGRAKANEPIQSGCAVHLY